MGILIGIGSIKSNRVIGSVPVPISAEVPVADATTLVITFDQALNGFSVPASSAFAIAGKVITNVSVVGSLVTLTVSVIFDILDTGLTVSYTQPSSNKLLSAVGNSRVASFISHPVTNSFGALIKDGNTVGLYDYLSGVTKDGSNHVTAWANKLGVTNSDFVLYGGTPHWSADGILFDPATSDYLQTNTFTYAQPEMMYLVMKQPTWAHNKGILDGKVNISAALLQYGSTPEVRGYSTGFGDTTTDITLDTWKIVRVSWGVVGAIKNQIKVGTVVGSAVNTSPNAMNGITLGATGGLGVFANLQIKEGIFRKIGDTALNEAGIYNYLAKKYSL